MENHRLFKIAAALGTLFGVIGVAIGVAQWMGIAAATLLVIIICHALLN